jgi:hypothetical protein
MLYDVGPPPPDGVVVALRFTFPSGMVKVPTFPEMVTCIGPFVELALTLFRVAPVDTLTCTDCPGVAGFGLTVRITPLVG